MPDRAPSTFWKQLNISAESRQKFGQVLMESGDRRERLWSAAAEAAASTQRTLGKLRLQANWAYLTAHIRSPHDRTCLSEQKIGAPLRTGGAGIRPGRCLGDRHSRKLPGDDAARDRRLGFLRLYEGGVDRRASRFVWHRTCARRLRRSYPTHALAYSVAADPEQFSLGTTRRAAVGQVMLVAAK
jgi:hypothetical protein